MAPFNDIPPTAEARERAAPIITWLMSEQRLGRARTPVLLDNFVRHLVEAEVPVDRVSLHLQQLHPQLAARSFVWDYEVGGALETDHDHSTRNEAAYLSSPIKPVFESGATLRRRLDGDGPGLDFPILADLRARNFTDYSIQPLIFSGSRPNAISVATRWPGGFSDPDLAVFDATLSAFGAVLELRQLRRTAQDLLATYVGPRTGQRIFDGAIRRGDGDVMHAVLWYCDLRGFTALSEDLPLAEVIGLLNDYFDAIAEPVESCGGEILKFVGDAMLAIFPCGTEQDALCQSADIAIRAAEAAVDRIAGLSETRKTVGKPPLQVGIAIHIGEVMYGNIGSASRLDFTVIGPAVNLVTRLEPLCAEMDCSIILSERLARAVRQEVRSLGRHKLKGIAEPQEAFAPA